MYLKINSTKTLIRHELAAENHFGRRPWSSRCSTRWLARACIRVDAARGCLAPLTEPSPHHSHVRAPADAQKPEAKKDGKKAKPAKKLPTIPGLDSSLFKQAMAEQKANGVEMKGPKIGRYVLRAVLLCRCRRCVDAGSACADQPPANLAGKRGAHGAEWQGV